MNKVMTFPLFLCSITISFISLSLFRPSMTFMYICNALTSTRFIKWPLNFFYACEISEVLLQTPFQHLAAELDVQFAA